MSLRSLVNGVTSAVNPNVPGDLYQSDDFTIAATGKQVPKYKAKVTKPVQVQALSAKDLQHLAGLNITGVLQKIYLDGQWESIVRAQLKGGDKFVISGQTWLVVQVLERWSDWCSVAVNLQVNP